MQKKGYLFLKAGLKLLNKSYFAKLDLNNRAWKCKRPISYLMLKVFLKCK
jgi:hypothetical protein